MRSETKPPRVVAVLMFLAAACASGEGGHGAGVTIDTVAGVVHVTNAGAGVWAEAGWRVGSPVRIGGDAMAEEEYAFGNIAGLTVGPDRRIYVADGQALEVRVYSASGEFLFRFGRSGEGPGEFGAVDALARSPGGDILARDPQLFRVTRFSPEGEYVSQFRIERPFPQYAEGRGFFVDDDGIVYDRLSTTLGIESDDSLTLVRYSPEGSVLDSVLAAQSPKRNVTVLKDGQPYMGLTLPFASFGSATVGPRGAIARSTGDAYTFDLLQPDGTVTRTISRDVRPVPVTAAERDSALTSMREVVRRYADGGQLENFELPETKAAITRLMADAEGNWWVAANGAANRLTPPDRFDVFDPEGRYLGSVDMPLVPLEIGADYVAGVTTDELGVQAVAVAPLIKATG